MNLPSLVSHEPRKLPALALKKTGSWKTQFTTRTHQCEDCLHNLWLWREIALDFSTIYPFNVTQNNSDSENVIFMTHFLHFRVCQKIMISYTSGSHVHKFVFSFHRCLDVQLQTLFWMATLPHCVNTSPWILNRYNLFLSKWNETKMEFKEWRQIKQTVPLSLPLKQQIKRSIPNHGFIRQELLKMMRCLCLGLAQIVPFFN